MTCRMRSARARCLDAIKEQETFHVPLALSGSGWGRQVTMRSFDPALALRCQRFRWRTDSRSGIDVRSRFSSEKLS